MASPLYQNKIEIIASMGFKVTWKLLSIGLYGSKEIPVILTRDEFFEYLDRFLINTDLPTDSMISLICERNDVSAADNLLRTLASNEQSNASLQIRKWRAYLLKSLLDSIGHDYLQGLLDLMEFWVSMGRPNECPHIFPNTYGAMAVQYYFTQPTYDFLVNKNRNWLSQEINNIIRVEEK